jgi:pantetheine-phosphate adenylyltransferase
MKVALYPGTFDPITIGHTDIIDKALRVFDEVVVGIAVNPKKNCMFDVVTRMRLITRIAESYHGLVSVTHYACLTIETAKEIGACAIIRGVRGMTDFEYEFQLAMINQDLESAIPTVFFTPKLKNFFLSSSMVKELAKHNQAYDHLVHPCVFNKIEEALGRTS